MTFGRAARRLNAHGIARIISKEEARELMQKVKKAGLVQMGASFSF